MKPGFRRDGATWFLYLSLAVFGFQQSVLGSTLPFLRKELHFDTVDVGWHFTFYAVGLVASGALSGRLLGRLRVDALVRLGTVLMVAAVLCITQATGPYGTIACATAMGLTGGILQAAVQAGIAWHQPEYRDVAMIEAFIFAGTGVFAGPLLVGQIASAGASWRIALLVYAVVAAVCLLVFHGSKVDRAEPAKDADAPDAGGMARIPLPVLLCWVMVLLGIGAEWGVGFWGAQFLESRLGLEPAHAVRLMAVFFGGTVFGRIVSSRMLAVFDVRAMLLIVIVLSSSALLLLWGSAHSSTTVVALAVAGMCLGNFFPLIISNAIRLAPHRVGLISVGATQAVGVALLVVPIVLGYVGQTIGLVNAIGMLALLPLLMAAAYLLAARRRAAAQRVAGGAGTR